MDGANAKMLRVVKNVTWRQRIINEVLSGSGSEYIRRRSQSMAMSATEQGERNICFHRRPPPSPQSCFMQDYLGSQPQLERGSFGSAVIAGEIRKEVVSDLVLWEPQHGKRSI